MILHNARRECFKHDRNGLKRLENEENKKEEKKKQKKQKKKKRRKDAKEEKRNVEKSKQFRVISR